MPIDLKKYPRNWTAIAVWVKARARGRCEMCHEPHSVGNGRVLTVHHLTPDPMLCWSWNLVALCAPCHLAVHRPGDRGFALDPQLLLFTPEEDPPSHRWARIAATWRAGTASLARGEPIGVDLTKAPRPLPWPDPTPHTLTQQQPAPAGGDHA